MRFALICRDNPGALQTRLENRAAHLGYIEATGVVEQAGPFLDEAGQMCGSLVILGVGSRAEAEAWAAGDPYAKAGLFSDVTIEEWKRVIGG
ncbi:MAG: YciI family protein [Tabrizicola sp.]|uniref:YciI family protein n=1 Tax=Tabrizicola sp. TaxID=2005166 RepID=UPI002732E7E4|nr:YciI family protein [Tabrizicola sp.]MDP3261680.1 YciI family protein [Tabrizicola sp.]MDP3648250.1 YciI family protein [Paracoccaceae bacterium]MDZ4066673.1 YciI family protein [Tabrizicola sp.]